MSESQPAPAKPKPATWLQCFLHLAPWLSAAGLHFIALAPWSMHRCNPLPYYRPPA